MKAFNLDIVDSTNDAARRLVADGLIRGTAYVLARGQTAGRGTSGRTWISPPDAGIYLSVVRTDLGRVSPDTSTVTLAAGAACIEALKDFTSLDVHLKPVNDLIVNGRKLGGILTETTVESGQITSLIVGIGINLRRANRSLPSEAIPAISLEEAIPSASFQALNQKKLVELIVAKVDGYNSRVLSGGVTEIRETWQRYLRPLEPGPSII